MRPLEAPSDHPKEVSAIAAFLIADIDIADPTTYEDYKRQVAPLIARFGGRYLARGGPHEVLEGDWEPHRLVVLEFPDMASLKAWYGPCCTDQREDAVVLPSPAF